MIPIRRNMILGLVLILLSATSFCYGDQKTVEVVGIGECADCHLNNIKNTHAFKGLKVTIDCKHANGEMKTRGVGELDEEGKFRVEFPQELVENGKLKEECYAQLHSASDDALCPTENGIESSKLTFVSEYDGKHTFSPVGKLKFSPMTCTSAFLWPFHKKPFFKKPLPHIPIFKKPIPHHIPIYKKPIPHVPIYKKPIPHVPIYKKPIPHHVPVYKKPIPHHVPIYKKPIPHPVPIYKKPIPPVPIYKEPIYKKPLPHLPIYKKPLPHIPIYKKPCPPIYKKPFPHHPIPVFEKPPIPVFEPKPLPTFPPHPELEKFPDIPHP